MKNNKAVNAADSKITPIKRLDIGSYFTTKILILIGLVLLLIAGLAAGILYIPRQKEGNAAVKIENRHWLLLHRKSNTEYLMEGVPGNKARSIIARTMKVKAGVPGKKPTPLPQLLKRNYWVLTRKFETADNPETSPYFIELNIPVSEEPPYGPAPYLECGGQCNWELPGPFGLHGVNGDSTRLVSENEGSSGCIRHADEDIAYLYNLLKPEEEQIRYYIEDI